MKASKSLQMVVLSVAALFLFIAAGPVSAAAEESVLVGNKGGERGESTSPAPVSGGVSGFFQRLGAPERQTVALALASSYDPNFNISSIILSSAALYDHGYLWDSVRSGTTAFKLEAAAGSMVRPDIRAIASVNMLALYYPPLPPSKTLRPYLEAGIGAIYTDYRVEKQAYRFNFNPQIGIGTEIRGAGSSYFVALRLHHISNGSTNRDNQGVNSLLLQLGQFF